MDIIKGISRKVLNISLILSYLISLGISSCSPGRKHISPSFLGIIETNPTSITSDFSGLDIKVRVIDSNYLGVNPLLVVIIPANDAMLINVGGMFAQLSNTDPVPATYNYFADDLTKIYKGQVVHSIGLMKTSSSEANTFQARLEIPSDFVSELTVPSIEIYVILLGEDNKESARQHISINYGQSFATNGPEPTITSTPFNTTLVCPDVIGANEICLIGTVTDYQFISDETGGYGVDNLSVLKLGSNIHVKDESRSWVFVKQADTPCFGTWQEAWVGFIVIAYGEFTTPRTYTDLKDMVFTICPSENYYFKLIGQAP